MAGPTHPMLPPAISVPRTDYTADTDDSDDNRDGSDGGPNGTVKCVKQAHFLRKEIDTIFLEIQMMRLENGLVKAFQQNKSGNMWERWGQIRKREPEKDERWL